MSLDLQSVESQRTGLVQTLVLVIMLVMGLILVLSWRSGGYLIPSLALVCLVSCLYVLARERKLKVLHYQLLEELQKRGVRVRYLDRKLKQEEDRTSEVFQLTRALSRIHSQSSSNRIYDTALEVAMDMVGGNCASILLLQDDDRLHFQRVIGLAPGVSELTLGRGRGMAGWVIENQQPLLLLEDRISDERLADPVSMRVEAQMAMAVPIPIDGKIRGVMCLGSTDPEVFQKFSEENLRLVNMLCQYASSAIELAGIKVGGMGATISVPLPSSGPIPNETGGPLAKEPTSSDLGESTREAGGPELPNADDVEFQIELESDQPVPPPVVLPLEVPEAEVPEAEVPEAGVPETEVPEVEVPEVEVPEAEVPEVEVTEAEVTDPEGATHSHSDQPDQPDQPVETESEPEQDPDSVATLVAEIEVGPAETPAEAVAGSWQSDSRELGSQEQAAAPESNAAAEDEPEEDFTELPTEELPTEELPTDEQPTDEQPTEEQPAAELAIEEAPAFVAPPVVAGPIDYDSSDSAQEPPSTASLTSADEPVLAEPLNAASAEVESVDDPEAEQALAEQTPSDQEEPSREEPESEETSTHEAVEPDPQDESINDDLSFEPAPVPVAEETPIAQPAVAESLEPESMLTEDASSGDRDSKDDESPIDHEAATEFMAREELLELARESMPESSPEAAPEPESVAEEEDSPLPDQEVADVPQLEASEEDSFDELADFPRLAGPELKTVIADYIDTGLQLKITAEPAAPPPSREYRPKIVTELPVDELPSADPGPALSEIQLKAREILQRREKENAAREAQKLAGTVQLDSETLRNLHQDGESVEERISPEAQRTLADTGVETDDSTDSEIEQQVITRVDMALETSDDEIDQALLDFCATDTDTMQAVSAPDGADGEEPEEPAASASHAQALDSEEPVGELAEDVSLEEAETLVAEAPEPIADPDDGEADEAAPNDPVAEKPRSEDEDADDESLEEEKTASETVSDPAGEDHPVEDGEELEPIGF